MSISTTRFSDRVENYIKYRSVYPAEVIDYLKSEYILKSDSVITDIGSGTGMTEYDTKIYINSNQLS